MKTLLVTSKPFLPSIDGGTAASESFVKNLLSEKFEIKHLSFSSEKHPFDKKLYETDEWNTLKTESISIHLKPNLIRACQAIILGKSYQLSRFESKEMLTAFKKSINTCFFDFIVLDSLYSAQMIEKLKRLAPDTKFILRMHNVESKITHQKARLEKKWWKRSYLKLLAHQIKKREKRILHQCDLILSISEEDCIIFRSWTSSRVITLPYFPSQKELKWSDTPDSFMHFGAMNWNPNVMSYEKLRDKLFPRILEACPNSKLKVAGSFMESLEALNSSQIELLGFVPDKFEFLSTNGILLAPIETGSGVKVKIIDALSIGVPVITTAAGAQGIPVNNNDGLIVCKTDEEFILQAIALSRDKNKRTELSQKASDFYTNWHSSYSLSNLIRDNVR